MSDLAAALAWLRARLDEDEAAALAAGGKAWATGRTVGHTYGRHGDQPHGTVIFDGDGEWPRPETVDDSHVYEVGGRMLILDPVGGPEVCRHIARQDPASTLARVAAFRDLLGVLLDYEASVDSEWGCCHTAEEIASGECPDPSLIWARALRALARPYADLPDFPEVLHD